MHKVVDTNVLITANGHDCPQASPQCILNCAHELQKIQQQGILVLDQDWHILREYQHKVNSSGQPGVGDAFLKWVLINQKNPRCCEQVSITVLRDDNFAEFPTTPALQTFDRSDRKFVAVALSHPAKPPICNAVDSDWKDFQELLAQAGVTVEFLCPELLLTSGF